MKLVLKLKLLTDPRADQLLRDTNDRYSLGCNRLSHIAFENQSFSRYDLHALAYYQVKAEFELPAQLVIRAIAEVCSAYKTLHTQIAEQNRSCEPDERRELEVIEFHPNVAIPYDQRILLMDTARQRVSVRTLQKRIWLNFQVGEKREPLLQYVQGQADLKRYGKDWFLFQTLEVPEADPVDATNHLGVDCGICTVASCTDGNETLRFPGDRIRQVRRHHSQLRRGLQRHNTYSSRRRVRTLRNRESRRVRTLNHLISRRIVEQDC